jgi:biopolymer transport protein ExbD
MAFSNVREGVRGDINVTPLVDVCLVLLIVFMILMPAIVREIPVQLPEAGPGRSSVGPGPIQVSMLEDRTILLEKQVVALDDLPAALRLLHDTSRDRAVVVQGDKRLPYQELSRVLESLDDAGFSKIGLQTVRAGEGG